MTLAIIDTAPHAAPDVGRIVRAVDLVVIPVRPAAFDIAAAGSAVDLVKATNVRAVFVLSACPFRSPEMAETRTVLADYGLPIFPAEITTIAVLVRPVQKTRTRAMHCDCGGSP
jgi:chromosome partitioning protein